MQKFSPEEKYRIVAEGNKNPKNIKETCEKYGISRETFYQWDARIKNAALSALEDKPPGPKPPQRETDTEELEKKLEQLEIENAKLQLKQEWFQFQVELHGTPELQKLIDPGKKNSTQPPKKSGSWRKK